MTEYEAAYTAKDLILYALSLGMGSQVDDASELKFLYERDDKFVGVPTFCFAFTFWAMRNRKENRIGISTTQRIPPFPPPVMSDEEVIPRRFRRNNTDISNMPVIHTWQSIVWHRPIEVPTSNLAVTVHINSETIATQPKTIGTFVTSQSNVTRPNNNRQPLCTMQSTALVLGMDPKNVISFNAGIKRLTSNPKIPSKSEQTEGKKTPVFEWTYQTTQSQALLYRMASGDSNNIHVDTSASEMLGANKKAPLLHGLFTLALAFRAILKLFDTDPYRSSLRHEFGGVEDCEFFFRKLEGAFKAPGFVGDCLSIKIWDLSSTPEGVKTNKTFKRFLFVIINNDSGRKLVDNGYAEIEIASKTLSSASRSRL